MANDPMAFYDSGEISSKSSRRNSILSKVSNVGHALSDTATGAARGAVDFTLGENSPELVRSHREAAMLALGGPMGAMLSKSIAKQTTSALANTINRFKSSLGDGYGGGSDGYYDDISNASSPDKSKSPLKAIEEIEETFKNDDGTTTKRRTKIRNNGKKQIIDYRETSNSSFDKNRFKNKSGFAGESMVKVGPTGKNITNSMMESGYGNINTVNKYGAKDSLTKKDLSFITHLSKSIAAKLEKSEEKTRSAKLFHNLSKGFGEAAYLTIVPNIRLLSASRYSAQLPNAKKVGVFNAMNITLGMIYASQRSISSETNRLLYSLVQVNKIGMGVDLKVAAPSDVSAGSELVSSGVKKLVKAPFKLLAAEISDLIGFTRPDDIYHGGKGRGGGGSTGGRRMKTAGEFMGGVRRGVASTIKSSIMFEAARGALLGSGTLGMLGAIPYVPALAAGAIGWNMGGKQMIKGAGNFVANKYRNIRQGMKERKPAGMLNWGLDKIEAGFGKAFMTGSESTKEEGSPAELYTLLKMNASRDSKYQETVVALLMRLNKMDKLDQEIQEKNLEITTKEHKQASWWRKMQTFFSMLKPLSMGMDLVKSILSGVGGLLNTSMIGLLGALGLGGLTAATWGDGTTGNNKVRGMGQGAFQSFLKGRNSLSNYFGARFGKGSKVSGTPNPSIKSLSSPKASNVPQIPENIKPNMGVANGLTEIAESSGDDIVKSLGAATWKETVGNMTSKVSGLGGKALGKLKGAMGGGVGAALTAGVMGYRAYEGEDLTNIGTTTVTGLAGASAGATIGTFLIPIPIVGTVVGAIIGALLSGVTTYFAGDKINAFTNSIGDSIFSVAGSMKDWMVSAFEDSSLWVRENLTSAIDMVKIGFGNMMDMMVGIIGGISKFLYDTIADSPLSYAIPQPTLDFLEKLSKVGGGTTKFGEKAKSQAFKNALSYYDERQALNKTQADRRSAREAQDAAVAEMKGSETYYDKNTNSLQMRMPTDTTIPSENPSQSMLGNLKNGIINAYNTVAPPSIEFNGMGPLMNSATQSYNTVVPDGYEINGGSNFSGNGNIPSNLVSEMQAAQQKYGIDYIGLVNDAANKTGLDPGLIAAVMRTESNFNPNSVSRSNAKGLFQFLDSTDRDFMPELSSTNPNQAVLKGASYLKYLINYFKGDIQKGILAYNFGMGNVEKGRPLTPEAANYVPKVMKFWKGGLGATVQTAKDKVNGAVESVENFAYNLPSIKAPLNNAVNSVENFAYNADLNQLKTGASNLWNSAKDASVWGFDKSSTAMPQTVEDAKQLVKDKINSKPELKEYFESKYNMSIDELLDTKEMSDKIKALMTSNNISGAIANGNEVLGQSLNSLGAGVNNMVSTVSVMSSNVSSASNTIANNLSKQNTDDEWITDDLPADVQALLFAQFD